MFKLVWPRQGIYFHRIDSQQISSKSCCHLRIKPYLSCPGRIFSRLPFYFLIALTKVKMLTINYLSSVCLTYCTSVTISLSLRVFVTTNDECMHVIACMLSKVINCHKKKLNTLTRYAYAQQLTSFYSASSSSNEVYSII